MANSRKPIVQITLKTLQEAVARLQTGDGRAFVPVWHEDVFSEYSDESDGSTTISFLLFKSKV